MKKEEFVKRIPQELQEKIGLKRFKISLIKCISKTQIKKAKMLLDYKFEEILKISDLQTKEKSVKYLKESLNLYLLNENIKGFDLMNEKVEVEKVEKKINIITIQSIMEYAIEKQKEKFIEKMDLLKGQGINTDIKLDSTLGSYNAILKSINKHFGLDYDIDNLTYDIVDDYAKTINNTYLQHLKSIFTKAQDRNSNIINWFSKVDKSISTRFGNVNKIIKTFKYSEIENILSNLKNEEEQNYFLCLIYSGLRSEELASLRIWDVMNNCLYVNDSKSYFAKVIPIHHTLVDYINNKIKNSTNKEDYLFFNNSNNKSRVNTIRSKKYNNTKSFKSIKKTLHNTRATFVSYLNYYKNDFNNNDITCLTHKVSGADQEFYNKFKNIKRLRKIIDSIDLKNLDLIEDHIEDDIEDDIEE
ncbi:MAG: site-specific integrase [Aliarcobacter sp.]|jgi:integrase|nr:site-specific integrase [Aliarcobacter sp.]